MFCKATHQYSTTTVALFMRPAVESIAVKSTSVGCTKTESIKTL
jgi:hypothetical protein